MKFVKESLFSAVVRSFFISFFAVIGIVIAFFVVMVIFGSGKNARATETSTFDLVIPDTNGHKYVMQPHQPLLLRINIVGEVGKEGLTIGGIRSILNGSTMGSFKLNPIKGILLYINTPGGAATDSNSIYFAIKEYAQKYQIPVYAYTDGYCASGGMYIACSADKIYASSPSMIGSVGVVQLFFNLSQGMNKVGVENKTITMGKNKFAMNPFQPWQEGDETNYVQGAQLMYDQFVEVVSSARPKLTPALLKNTYGAGFFYSTVAEQYGYIDGAGYQYDEVVEMLAQAAEIENYQTVELQPKTSLKDLLPWSGWNMRSSLLKEKINDALRSPFFLLDPTEKDLLKLHLSAPNQ